MIAETLQTSFPSIHILNSNIPRRARFAEGGVAYLEGGEAKEIFVALGNEIRGKVGL